MKRIAGTVIAVSLAGAAAFATAADTPYPSSAEDSYSQYEVFHNVPTYEQAHRDSELAQAPMSSPSGRSDNYNATSVFPNMVTYEQQHRNDSVQASNARDYPSSADEEASMAEEGLVPGIVGIAPYDNRSHDAVGATGE